VQCEEKILENPTIPMVIPHHTLQACDCNTVATVNVNPPHTAVTSISTNSREKTFKYKVNAVFASGSSSLSRC